MAEYIRYIYIYISIYLCNLNPHGFIFCKRKKERKKEKRRIETWETEKAIHTKRKRFIYLINLL